MANTVPDLFISVLARVNEHVLNSVENLATKLKKASQDGINILNSDSCVCMEGTLKEVTALQNSIFETKNVYIFINGNEDTRLEKLLSGQDVWGERHINVRATANVPYDILTACYILNKGGNHIQAELTKSRTRLMVTDMSDATITLRIESSSAGCNLNDILLKYMPPITMTPIGNFLASNFHNSLPALPCVVAFKCAHHIWCIKALVANNEHDKWREQLRNAVEAPFEINKFLHGLNKPTGSTVSESNPDFEQEHDDVAPMVFCTPNRNTTILIWKADITKMQVYAVVNATDEQLKHIVGVSWAIAKAAGPQLNHESWQYIQNYGPIPLSTVCTTTAGYMPAKKVVHVVGPVWREHDLQSARKALCLAFYNCLETAQKHSFASIAIPAISSGIYGAPKSEVADMAVQAVIFFYKKFPFSCVKYIHFVDIISEIVSEIQQAFVKYELKNGFTKDNIYDQFEKWLGRPPGAYDTSSFSKTFDPSTSWDSHSNFSLENSDYKGQNGVQLLRPQAVAANAYEIPAVYDKKHHPETGGASSSPASTSNPVQTAEAGTPAAAVAGEKKEEEDTCSICMEIPTNKKVLHKCKHVFCKDCIDDYFKVVNPKCPNCFTVYGVRPASTSNPVQTAEAGTPAAAVAGEKKEDEDTCSICMEFPTNKKVLHKCKHVLCKDCIDHYFKAVNPKCPNCFTVYGELRGNQPENGTMTHNTTKMELPGYKHCGTIEIQYNFPNGIQSEIHPDPGKPYSGTYTKAYLPDNKEGQKVLGLLKKAFDARLVFTIGTSATTGLANTVIWKCIHHKTNTHGGTTGYGYPDRTYLSRVQEELAAQGIK